MPQLNESSQNSIRRYALMVIGFQEYIEYFEDGPKGCALRFEKMHLVQNIEPDTETCPPLASWAKGDVLKLALTDNRVKRTY